MKKHRGIIALVVGATLMSGCTGKLDYIEPTTTAKHDNSITINIAKDRIWNSAIHKLSDQFFDINNLDKSSGLINLSYSGSPESYVDCGRIISYVNNARGGRTYDFQASKASQKYEVMQNIYPFDIHRKMWVEGHINLILEELGPNKTRITAKTKYVLSRMVTVQGIFGGPLTETDSISFNSNNGASFPAASDGRATECVSTGKLESEILQTIK